MHERIPPLLTASGPLGPGLDLQYEPSALVRFEPDHPEGPVTGLVYNTPEDVRLIVLEHNLFFHKALTDSNGRPVPLTLTGGEVQMLAYTPQEWVAFYLGIGLGEYDYLYNGAAEVSIRDSKSPNDHYFTFGGEVYRSWIDGIKSGKYALPAHQHAVISSWLNMKLRSKNAGVTVL